jgi:hypothetical protein
LLVADKCQASSEFRVGDSQIMDLQNKEDDLPHHMPPLGPPRLFQSALDFGRVPRGGYKTLQQVIANTNKQSVIWLGESCAARWLTLEPDRGVLQPGEQQLIRVTANTASLAVGEYSVTLTFSLVGDETSMSTDIAGKMIVEEQHMQPTPLGVSVNFGELRPQSTRNLELVVSNPDDHAIKWDVTIGDAVQETLEHQKDHAGNDIPAGIQKNVDLKEKKGVSLSQESVTLKPHESKTISITARADELEEGHSYSTTLTFVKNGDPSTSVPIPVLFYVTTLMQPLYDGGPKPPAGLPTVLSISQAQGTANLDFTNPEENGQVKWQLSSDRLWLTTNPTTALLAGGAQAQVVVTSHGTFGQTAHLTLKLNYDPLRPGFVETDVTIPVTIVA